MPYSEGTKPMRSVSTVVLAIVALTIVGVLAVLGVLLFGGQSASAERNAAVIAGVFAFITPTIAALLAFLRATDAGNAASNAAVAGIAALEETEKVKEKVTEVHQHINDINGTVTERLDSLEQTRHVNEQG